MGVGQCMVSECSVGSMSDQLAVSGGPLGGQWVFFVRHCAVSEWSVGGQRLASGDQ